jgi:hypothetical protein
MVNVDANWLKETIKDMQDVERSLIGSLKHPGTEECALALEEIRAQLERLERYEKELNENPDSKS